MIPTAEIKRALGIPTADTSRDTDIAYAEAAAVAYVERATGRYFGEPREFIQYFDGAQTAALYLDEPPLVDIYGALLDPFEVASRAGATWTAAETDTYDIDGARVIAVDSVWASGSRNLRVTYTAGYEAGTEPADIRAAVLALAVAMFREQDAAGLQSESIGGYSYSLATTTLDTTTKRTLHAWRRVLV